MTAHIVLSGEPIPIEVKENQFYLTIQLGTELGDRLLKVEWYFRDYPEQFERLVNGEKICL